MRGLVTLATAFALPADFPQRDLIVLTAFAVVLATLVVQGLTLAPLVRRLKLDGEDGWRPNSRRARRLAAAALETLKGQRRSPITGASPSKPRAPPRPRGRSRPLDTRRRLGLAALRRQRQRLEDTREQRVDAEAFLILQEELDFLEVTLTSEANATSRRVEMGPSTGPTRVATDRQ